MTADFTIPDTAIEEAGMRVWFALHPSDQAKSKALRKALGKGDNLGREWYLEVGRAALAAAAPYLTADAAAAERERIATAIEDMRIGGRDYDYSARIVQADAARIVRADPEEAK